MLKKIFTNFWIFISILSSSIVFAETPLAPKQKIIRSVMWVIHDIKNPKCMDMFMKIDGQVKALLYHHIYHHEETTDVLSKVINKLNEQAGTHSHPTKTAVDTLISPGPGDILHTCPNWPNLTISDKAHIYSLLLTMMANFEISCDNNRNNPEATDGVGYGWFQARKPYSSVNMLTWGFAQLARQIQAEYNAKSKIFWENAKGHNYWAVLIEKPFTDKIKTKIKNIPECQRN